MHELDLNILFFLDSYLLFFLTAISVYFVLKIAVVPLVFVEKKDIVFPMKPNEIPSCLLFFFCSVIKNLIQFVRRKNKYPNEDEEESHIISKVSCTF